jgi:hypothetical protein
MLWSSECYQSTLQFKTVHECLHSYGSSQALILFLILFIILGRVYLVMTMERLRLLAEFPPHYLHWTRHPNET